MFRFILSNVIFLFWCTLGLANGLVDLSNLSDLKRAYFLQDSSSQEVSLQLIIHTGEFDLSGPEGLAHYLEHLVFADADSTEPTERHANAVTTGTYTRYWTVGTPDQLESMLEKMARVLETPTVSRTYAIEEIDIIKREYQLTFGNDPLTKISANLIAQLYVGQGQARSVIGSPIHHEQFSPDKAYVVHQRHYTTGNASLFVTGDIDENEVKRLLSKTFPPPSAENSIVQVANLESSETNSSNVQTIVEPKLSNSRLLYFKDIELSNHMSFEATEAAFDLLYAILDSTLEGGIAKPLRFDNFIVAGYDLGLSQKHNGRALLSFVARPDRGVTPQRSLQVFEQTLENISNNGIPLSTFERVKNNELEFFASIADDEELAIDLAMTGLLADQNPMTTANYIDQFTKTSIEDLNSILNSVVSSNHIAAALVYPNN